MDDFSLARPAEHLIMGDGSVDLADGDQARLPPFRGPDVRGASLYWRHSIPSS
jgi:hypothetical protein